VESEREKPGRAATSPYLRRPIRSLEEARSATLTGGEPPTEQAEERLDNHVFRLNGARG
jgi:organic radical activating enzyme